MTTKRAKKGGATQPPTIQVSEQELEQAKSVVKDEEEKKRQNSKLQYWLGQRGAKDGFKDMPAAERKEYFWRWMAAQMKQGKTAEVGKKTHSTTELNKDKFIWLCKKELEDRFGEVKAAGKMKSCKSRPDRDSGGTDSESLEYKICVDEEEKIEAEADERMLETATDVPASASDDVQVPGPEATPKTEQEKQKEAEEAEINKIKENLEKHAKHVLRTLGDQLVSMKKAFVQCKENKYAGLLREDCGKAIPKAATLYKSLTKVITGENADEVENEDESYDWTSLAKRLHAHNKKYMEIHNWVAKFFKKPPTAKKEPDAC